MPKIKSKINVYNKKVLQPNPTEPPKKKKNIQFPCERILLNEWKMFSVKYFMTLKWNDNK